MQILDFVFDQLDKGFKITLIKLKTSLTGYKNMYNPDRLIEVCKVIVSNKAYQPVLDDKGNLVKTFCNEGACAVAVQYANCHELEDSNGQPLLCELIYEKFNNNPD